MTRRVASAGHGGHWRPRGGRGGQHTSPLVSRLRVPMMTGSGVSGGRVTRWRCAQHVRFWCSSMIEGPWGAMLELFMAAGSGESRLPPSRTSGREVLTRCLFREIEWTRKREERLEAQVVATFETRSREFPGRRGHWRTGQLAPRLGGVQVIRQWAMPTAMDKLPIASASATHAMCHREPPATSRFSRT